jgi:malonyl CoA-acyl carrier protein transacylase
VSKTNKTETAVEAEVEVPAAGPADAVALVFPGQGSQRSGMREVVEQEIPDLLEDAVKRLGADPIESIKEGTAFQQPALYLAAVAGWRAAGEPSADFITGHSLGEVAAAAAAGAVSVEDGLALSIARGRSMQDAAAAEPGGMLAVLGDLEGAGALAASLGLTVANDNAPGQVVLSGPRDEIDGARPKFKQAGLKTIRLPIDGAFHSPAMRSAIPGFRAALEAVEVHQPRTTLFSSITAQPFDDLREGLLSALTRPVRWRETVIELNDRGVGRFIESGPGEVLCGLIKRTLDGVEAVPLGSELSGSHA